MKQLIKVENWNKKGRYFVARDANGRFIESRRVKGSKLTKIQATEIYKQNKTFYESIRKELLSKFSEYVNEQPTTISERTTRPSRRPKGTTVQYVVSGWYKKTKIAARSSAIGTPLIKTARQAKEDAWQRFLALLGEKAGVGYDEDEGIKLIDKVKNLKEGWVYYR